MHDPRDAALGAALLIIARNAIARALGCRTQLEPEHPALSELAATFVTLHVRDKLRGCIGRLEAERPLGEDVRENASAAAFRDTRFAPLTADELGALQIEVSILSAPQPMSFSDETDLLRRLRPGIDGVILDWHGRRATFLPQVWASLPEPVEFMRALKLKAGWPADFWAPDVAVSHYTVTEYHEDYEENGHEGR